MSREVDASAGNSYLELQTQGRGSVPDDGGCVCWDLWGSGPVHGLASPWWLRQVWTSNLVCVLHRMLLAEVCFGICALIVGSGLSGRQSLQFEGPWARVGCRAVLVTGGKAPVQPAGSGFVLN